ncbi:MAG: hypothetical protein LBP21_03220 [Synergistaceae bacterium]|jgi:hypothetical protein|nr:hypothetical protein [Synergistaceae bacterium]
MFGVLLEILNLPVRSLLFLAELIGPDTARELRLFLNREGGNMRYIVGGVLWAFCVLSGLFSKTSQKGTD